MKCDKKYVIEINLNEANSLSYLLGYITREDVDKILTREGWDNEIAISCLYVAKKDLENLLANALR